MFFVHNAGVIILPFPITQYLKKQCTKAREEMSIKEIYHTQSRNNKGFLLFCVHNLPIILLLVLVRFIIYILFVFLYIHPSRLGPFNSVGRPYCCNELL